jgi:hypothetical protein
MAAGISEPVWLQTVTVTVMVTVTAMVIKDQ